GLTVVNDTQVNATFTISTAATGSARNVTVTAPGGTSNPVSFSVVALPAPTLTSIAPSVGLRGTSVPVTITGTDLTGATSLTVSGGGVSVSALNVMSSTEATATFTISAGASLGARSVRITTGSGTQHRITCTGQEVTLTFLD